MVVASTLQILIGPNSLNTLYLDDDWLRRFCFLYISIFKTENSRIYIELLNEKWNMILMKILNEF